MELFQRVTSVPDMPLFTPWNGRFGCSILFFKLLVEMMSLQSSLVFSPKRVHLAQLISTWFHTVLIATYARDAKDDGQIVTSSYLSADCSGCEVLTVL